MKLGGYSGDGGTDKSRS